MNINTHTLSPSTVETMTGVPAIHPRDWRTKGFIEQYGKQDSNRHWKYSFRDAVAIWFAWRLIGFGRDRRQACILAWEAAPYLIDFIRGTEADRQFVFSVEVFVQDSSTGVVGFASNFAGIEEAAEDHEQAERFDTYDLKRIAKTVPVGMREVAEDIENW